MYYEKITPLLAKEAAELFFSKYGNKATWKQFRAHVDQYMELFNDIEDVPFRRELRDRFTKELWSNLESLGFEFEFEER